MRIFHIGSGHVTELEQLPSALPEAGFIWVASARREFEVEMPHVQTFLHNTCGTTLLDLHISDLLNSQLPSHFDYTTVYDLLVFRRLAAGEQDADHLLEPRHANEVQRRGGPPVLRRIDTSPVGFAVFDRVLVSVHPAGSTVLNQYADRLMAIATNNARSTTGQMPMGPADLMVRLINVMVDGYLELRRELTRQLDHWQSELLRQDSRFTNWKALLDARIILHQLIEIGEDQRAAVQDWIESLAGWQALDGKGEHFGGQRGLEVLRVRSRDVLEHIERVIHHVLRLEQSAETAVAMHFSAQSNRTNDIMRTLTAITAIFLPLNLIAAVFGMNFDFLPWIHQPRGFWWALGAMGVISLSLGGFFWRKRLLARTAR